MTNEVFEPRYKVITPEIISSTNFEPHILKQQELLSCQEIANLDDVVELKGGRINAVYKGSMEGIKKVVKISSGIYRKIELRREAEALKMLGDQWGQHLVPRFSPCFYVLYLICGFTDMIDGLSFDLKNRGSIMECVKYFSDKVFINEDSYYKTC